MPLTAAELLELSQVSATELVDIPDVGKVRVRPLLGRDVMEVGRLQNAGKTDEAAALLIHKGLVDPPLTLEEARRLHDTASFAVFTAITGEISRVSGLDEGAQKSSRAATPPGGD